MKMQPRFSPKTLKFIEKASKQKDPKWLDRNRAEYESLVLTPFQNLAQTLKATVGPKASGYHFPQKGIGRLKRSVIRDEKNQGPFKEWVSYSASRPRVSRFEHNPSLYFHIQPDDEDGDYVLGAGGLYMPSSQQVRAIREAISENPAPFEKLFRTKSFSSCFPGGFSKDRISSRVPRGFDPSHPKIEWIRLQAFFVWRTYKMREFSSPNFPELVARDFLQVLKLNELLDLAISRRWPSLAAPARKHRPVISRLEEAEAPKHEMDF